MKIVSALKNSFSTSFEVVLSIALLLGFMFVSFTMVIVVPVMSNNIQQEMRRKNEAQLRGWGCVTYVVRIPDERSIWTCPGFLKKFTLDAFQKGLVELPPLSAEAVK